MCIANWSPSWPSSALDIILREEKLQVTQIREDDYAGSGLQSFMRLLEIMMQQRLLDVVFDSISAFVAFVRQYATVDCMMFQVSHCGLLG